MAVISEVWFSNSSLGTRCEIALKWMPLNSPNENPTLVQIMAWCNQAPSHYPNQFWTSSVMPNGINRPQRVMCEQLNLVKYIRHSFAKYNHVLPSCVQQELRRHDTVLWSSFHRQGREVLKWQSYNEFNGVVKLHDLEFQGPIAFTHCDIGMPNGILDLGTHWHK